MLTPNQLQNEHRPWSRANFGVVPPHQPLLGIIEELGDELERALQDWNVAEIKDALADTVVFTADYCNQRGWDLEVIFPSEDGYRICPAEDIRRAIERARRRASKVAHHQLKTEQGIRGTTEEHAVKAQAELGSMLIDLESVARHFGWTLMEVTESVWARVKLRDFRKNAVTGGEGSK